MNRSALKLDLVGARYYPQTYEAFALARAVSRFASPLIAYFASLELVALLSASLSALAWT
jgi:hypothetical protein